MALKLGQTVGDYELLRVLDASGSTKVFEAQNNRLRRTTAAC